MPRCKAQNTKRLELHFQAVLGDAVREVRLEWGQGKHVVGAFSEVRLEGSATFGNGGPRCAGLWMVSLCLEQEGVAPHAGARSDGGMKDERERAVDRTRS